MVENKQSDKEVVSETLFSKTISKMNKSGSREVGQMRVELKSYDSVLFVQMTQTKYAFGQTPQKRSWVTFSPDDKEIREALSEAIKKAKE